MKYFLSLLFLVVQYICHAQEVRNAHWTEIYWSPGYTMGPARYPKEIRVYIALDICYALRDQKANELIEFGLLRKGRSSRTKDGNLKISYKSDQGRRVAIYIDDWGESFYIYCMEIFDGLDRRRYYKNGYY